MSHTLENGESRAFGPGLFSLSAATATQLQWKPNGTFVDLIGGAFGAGDDNLVEIPETELKSVGGTISISKIQP